MVDIKKSKIFFPFGNKYAWVKTKHDFFLKRLFKSFKSLRDFRILPLIVFVIMGMFSFCKAKNNLPLDSINYFDSGEAEMNPVRLQEEFNHLKSREASRRAAAIIYLSSAPETAEHPLNRIFLYLLEEDSDPSVKISAALALSKRKHLPAGEKIHQLLKSEIGFSRFEDLIYALGELGYLQAQRDIASYILHKSLQTRLVATEALVKMKARNLFNFLMDLARQRGIVLEDEIRKSVIELSARINDKTAADFVLAEFNRLYALRKNKQNYSASSLAVCTFAVGRLKLTEIDRKLIELIDDDFEPLQKQAKDALVEWKDSKIATSLYTYFSHEKNNTHLVAAETLVAIGRSQTHEKEIVSLLNSADTAKDKALAFVCGRWKLAACADPLLKKINDKQNPGRKEIAEALGWMQYKPAISILEKVVQEENGKARIGAAISLGILRSQKSLPFLHSQLSKTDDGQFKLHIIDSLGLIADPASVDILDSELKQNSHLAIWILSSLSNIPDKKARQIIEENLFSTDEKIASSAFNAYLNYRDPAAGVVLKKLLKLEITKQKNYTKRVSSIVKILGEIYSSSEKNPKRWLD